MLFRRIFCLVAVSSAVTVGLAPSSQAEPPEAGANRAAHDVARDVGAYVELLRVEQVAADLEAAVGVHVAAVRAWEVAQAAAFVRAQYRPASRPAVRPSVPTVGNSVGSCGGATNGADRFIQRESHGEPYVWNTEGSGAWGCYQIMPATWASSCSDLGQHGSAGPEAQAACASRLPLSAWGG